MNTFSGRTSPSILKSHISICFSFERILNKAHLKDYRTPYISDLLDGASFQHAMPFNVVQRMQWHYVAAKANPKDRSYYNTRNLKIRRSRDWYSLIFVRISGHLGIIALGRIIASGNVTLITRRIRILRNNFSSKLNPFSFFSLRIM
jgi:hypothetical protein